MEYSPIEELEIKNFRNLGSVKISFRESPIVTLEGENEAGKTSVVKALAIAGANAYPNRQKKFIRDGTNGWGIICSLADGTSIVRIVTTANNTLALLKDGTEYWRADKIDRGEGIPVELSKLMGFIRENETGEMLNVRTYEDQLLFIVTPASTNYKVMYNALKIAQITKAIKLGTTQANQLKSEINSNELRMEALLDNIRAIRFYDIEPAVNIKTRVEAEIEKLEKLERAMEIINNIASIQSELGILQELVERNVQTVDIESVAKLVEVERVLTRISDIGRASSIYSGLSSCQDIDTSELSQITQAITIAKQSDEQLKKLEYIQLAENCELVDETSANRSEYAMQLLAKINRLRSTEEVYRPLIELSAQTDVEHLANTAMQIVQAYGEYASAYNELIQVKQQMDTITSEIQKSGGLVVSCTNCGELVAVTQ